MVGGESVKEIRKSSFIFV